MALKDVYAPVWERAAPGGMALGSLGAFLVLEAREHASARNAKPLGRLSRVLSEHSNRQAGATVIAVPNVARFADRLTSGHVAVISGATGAEPATSEERAWLETLSDVSARATGTYLATDPSHNSP